MRKLFIPAAFLACIVLGAVWPNTTDAAPSGTTCTGALCQADATGDVRVNSGAATSTLYAEWCPGVAVTTLPTAKYLSGAKALAVHNKSSATCTLGFSDAETITSTGTVGDEYAPGEKIAQDIDGSVFGPHITGVCTAATTTGACLKLRWWK